MQIGYAATKADIHASTVVPGQLHTPMVEPRLAKQRAGGDVEPRLRSRVARIPMGFTGDGRDTANAALFLASDEAGFTTGSEIVLDSGMTVRCDWPAARRRHPGADCRNLIRVHTAGPEPKPIRFNR